MRGSATRTRGGAPAAAVALGAVVALAALAPAASAQRPTQGEDESAALVAEGRAALRRGKLDDAAAALDQAIALNPRRVEAYVLRSGVYAARKQYRQGIAIMRRAQALAPDDDEVLTALGSQLVLSGDAAAGVPMLQQVVARSPRRYDAQVLLGHHWYAAGRWAEAIAALEAYFAARPRELEPEDAGPRVELADAYLRAREPAKALPLFQRAARERGGGARARIGAAWALAAIDCRRARPLLRELEPLAEAHPEIWLVDGRCAIALGEPATALALGQRYLDRAGPRSAAGHALGHALIGEAHAARGNLAEARRELEAARRLEPARRRWTVRYAAVLRRGGDPGGALAALEQLGPPARPAADADWWAELGEALLARGDPRAAAARLSPIAAELPGHAPIRVALGAAQLLAGEAELAAATLEEAERIASAPRSRKLLGEALAVVGARKLGAGDAAAAEPLLARAEALDASAGASAGSAGASASAAALRNLGVARLELGRPADAVPALERAARADGSPITAMLAARARALSRGAAAGRSLYERSLAAAAGDASIEIALDWAASELGPGGDPAVAVAALERTAGAARSGPLAARHQAALATARHAAGIAALRAGQGARAVELLRAAAAAAPSPAVRCDLALAAVAAGEPAAARAALRAVSGQRCPFPPPADVQAVPVLIALTDGLSPRLAPRALERLTSLGVRAGGPAATLRAAAVRVVALEAARAAYEGGAIAEARRLVGAARAAGTRVGADELALQLAAIDLAEGRLGEAIAALEKLAPRLPDALVHAGIAYEKQGEPLKALDAWRRARKAGVRFAPLAEWIEAKERIYGGAP